MTKRAAIYARISADREGRELGVDRQQQDCLNLIANYGHTHVGTFIDNDLSASTRSKKPRPQYLEMLDAARAGRIDVIVAYTSSRLTRRPRENEDLIDLAEKHGVEFLYLRSPSFDLNSAGGRLVARILAAADAAEAEATQERVTRAKLQAAQQGQWKGGRRPFGFEPDGATVRESEAAEIRKACTAILAGTSLNGIARDLNNRNVSTSTGRPWKPGELAKMLMRPRNAGLMEHQGQVIGKAIWPAIVPEATWRAVVAVLTNPERRTGPGPGRRWLGSGLFLCHCGHVVRVMIVGANRPNAHLSYVCSERRHMGRIVREVDAYIEQLVVERLSRDDAVDLVAADTGEDPAEAMVEESRLLGRLDQLAAQWASETLTDSQLATATAVLREQLDAVRSRIAHSARVSVLEGLVGAEDVAAAWKDLDLDRKRAVIKRLMTVELGPSGRGRRKGWKPGESYFDPTTVRISWND